MSRKRRKDQKGNEVMETEDAFPEEARGRDMTVGEEGEGGEERHWVRSCFHGGTDGVEERSGIRGVRAETTKGNGKKEPEAADGG